MRKLKRADDSMTSSLYKRLDALEQAMNPPRMRILCGLPDGTTAICTVNEMVDAGGIFGRVVSGGNLDDLDVILKQMKIRAERDVQSDAV